MPREPSRRLIVFGKALPEAPVIDTRPDHEQADPAWIRRALAQSQAKPCGGWYVLDASRSFGPAAPRALSVAGRPLVVFRSGSQLVAARDVCPHMGAALSAGRLAQGRLVCPWHGRTFGPEPCDGYKPLRTHDDGLLAWVQIDDGSEPLLDRPVLPVRPAAGLDAVIRVEAACDPADVIANRLDPWHGAHYHPHSFARLRVVERSEAHITVRVAYRVLGPLAVEVDARFDCPDARTIVMTIVRGDGAGSVVETHATPLRSGRSAIVELTVASSDRVGFKLICGLGRALRPVMQWAARRLWVEDAAYAERSYALRHGLGSETATTTSTSTLRSRRVRGAS